MSEVNMRLSLSLPLRSLVSNKFNQAHASQSLIFSDTHLTILHNKTGSPFQLRFCPALSKKPKDNQAPAPPPSASKPDSTTPKKKFDPFEDPSADLLVARLPGPNDYTHNLVLNKFPVIANHFILATRESKPQTNLLEEVDLDLTYACVQAWRDDQNSLYAFFNSGKHSGASQPHRHIQFLPIEDMRGSGSLTGWEPLCHRMTTSVHPALPLLHDPALPVVHLATPLSREMAPSTLRERYLLLMRATSILLASDKDQSTLYLSSLNASDLASAVIAANEGPTKFSYNLAITMDTMAILPRRAEDATISELAHKDTGSGNVSINGTILAGTLMVKNEDEWDLIRAKPELLDGMLKQVGFPCGEMPKI